MVARMAATIRRAKPAKGALVFYEDNLIDGRAPIEMMQSDAIKQTGAALDYLGFDEDEELVFMDSNLPIRLESDDLRISIAPDYYRSRNAPVARIRDDTGYNLSEIGKAPEFVLEVASRSTYRRDLYEKPDIYARIGVSELWMFDPTGGELYGQALMGFRLVDGEYEAVEIVENQHGLPSGYSEELGLRLCALEWSKRGEILSAQPNMKRVLSGNFQPWQLLFQNVKTGEYIINMRALRDEYRRVESERDMEREARESAETRANAAETRAESAEERAESERARAESEREARESAEERAESERARAESERARAESEREARESAGERMAELEAELRRVRDMGK